MQHPSGERKTHAELFRQANLLSSLGHEEGFIADALRQFDSGFPGQSPEENAKREENICGIAKAVCSEPPKSVSGCIKNATLRELAELSSQSFLHPVDAELAAQIEQEESDIIISAPDGSDEEEVKQNIKLMKINVTYGYIMKFGALIHAEGNRFYFLNKKESKLHDLEQPHWAAWLYSLCKGIIDLKIQKELTQELIVAARLSAPMPVYRFSFWDEANKTLFVSRFDGWVFKLDGNTTQLIRNGEGVLFDDPIDWVPYSPTDPLSKDDDPYRTLLFDFPQWDGYREEQSIALNAWILSLFFPELCPSRPIAVFLGEKGSGKSTLLRLILKYLFGKYADLSGVPDKPDAFVVQASHSHIVALDNMDEEVCWLQDKLARLATGAIETVRKLYSTNEPEVIHYRSFAAITARTPDTLKRDDLAERTITFRLRRIDEDAGPEPSFKIEREMFKHVEESRSQFWGALLSRLSAIVRAISSGLLPQASTFRLADWETLGRLISAIEANETLWDSTLEFFNKNQRRLLIEDEPILEALKNAITRGEIKIDVNTTYTANQLHQILTRKFGEQNQKPSDPSMRTVNTFAKKLSILFSTLRSEIGLRKRTGTSRANLNRNIYYFAPEDEAWPRRILNESTREIEGK